MSRVPGGRVRPMNLSRRMAGSGSTDVVRVTSVNLVEAQTEVIPGSQTEVREPGKLGNNWRRELLPLLLFLLLPLLSFPELFFLPRTLYRGDLTWIHYPLRLMAADQWRSGEIPLWNPYVLAGTPLLAEAQI